MHQRCLVFVKFVLIFFFLRNKFVPIWFSISLIIQWNMKTTLAHKKLYRKKKYILNLQLLGILINPKMQKTEKLRPLNLYSFKTISNHHHRKYNNKRRVNWKLKANQFSWEDAQLLEFATKGSESDYLYLLHPWPLNNKCSLLWRTHQKSNFIYSWNLERWLNCQSDRLCGKQRKKKKKSNYSFVF